jgi:AcrR family transcriptional regulator
MADRLTAQDWIDFALKTLAQEGFQALKADILARKLNVSRGSFYWHFAELRAFHVQVIAQWKRIATDAIIADLERQETSEQRLDLLLRRAFGQGTRLEMRMRGWAEDNAEAARALAAIDRKRLAYIKKTLAEAGVPAASAATRAQLLYWAYLGAVLSHGKLAGRPLEHMVAELKRLGLGAGRPTPPARG